MRGLSHPELAKALQAHIDAIHTAGKIVKKVGTCSKCGEMVRTVIYN